MVAERADTIAVIGTGHVGKALGIALARQGHPIVYGSRNPEGENALTLVRKTNGNAGAAVPADAAANAGTIILAVPGMMVEDTVKGLGDVSGKIIIDTTNPMTMNAVKTFSHAVETSNAEIVQAAAPRARVVKAFNTVSWTLMARPQDSDGPVSVPVAGDDITAKKKVADLAVEIGLAPIDIGPLEVARWTENCTVVSMNNRSSGRTPFNLLFRQVD